MRIGVSAWRLAGQRLGVGRYIEYMLKYWSEQLDAQDHVTVYVREPMSAEALGLGPRFSFEAVTPKLTNALWENLLLPSRARDEA